MSLLTVCAFVCITVSLLTVLTVYVRRGKFQTYCMSEWPTFGVGWPREGTFHLPTVLQVKAVIFRDKPDGHPEQVPNILVWQDIIENSPPWLKPLLPPKAHNSEKVRRDSGSTARLYGRSPGCRAQAYQSGRGMVMENRVRMRVQQPS